MGLIKMFKRHTLDKRDGLSGFLGDSERDLTNK